MLSGLDVRRKGYTKGGKTLLWHWNKVTIADIGIFAEASRSRNVALSINRRRCAPPEGFWEPAHPTQQSTTPRYNSRKANKPVQSGPTSTAEIEGPTRESARSVPLHPTGKGKHIYVYRTRCQMLRKTHVRLAEALLLVAPGRVGQVGGVLALHGDVVLKGDVADLDVIEGPISADSRSRGWRTRGAAVVKHRRKSKRGGAKLLLKVLFQQTHALFCGNIRSV